jgi:hypothetical protein
LSGINKQGDNPGSFSGFDRCGAQPAIPGVAVPTGGYNATAGGYTGIVGNPNNLPSELGTEAETEQAVDIDWAGIIAGTYLPPDYVHPAWPASWVDWPVVRVNNSGGPTFTLPAPGGKGILIVTGDLQLNGGVGWDGLVLVGGIITANGNNRLWGAVVSGLNVKLGMAVLPAAISNGQKDYKYDSCALARALGQVGSIQRVRNGWNDTWPSY